MRRFLMTFVLVCLLMFSAAALRAADKAPKPNIVYILADDLGFADCGFNGGKQIHTPSLDKLARQGTILDAFYVQPVCSPTRAALMTGRYPMRLGLQVGVIRPWADYGLSLDERTLAQGLRDAGYNTAICGKWHLGSFDKAYWPGARGFDLAYGHLFGALDYFTHIRDGKLDWYRNGEQLKEEGYTTNLVGREAVKFINEQSKDKPFFLYVPFNAVHSPHQAPARYIEPYKKLKAPRDTYAGMLAALDEAVGQIVEAVEKKGLRGNTLFIFSSDNGGPSPGKVTDNTPLRAGKGTLYEGGVRVCAFATWDGHLPAGQHTNQPLHMVDWYPTLLNLAGGSLEQKHAIDGRDCWATIAEGKPSPHDAILMNAAPGSGAIRMGDWKLVLHGLGDGPSGGARKAPPEKVELFDLSKDISEKANLADERPDKVMELRNRYNAFAREAAVPKNLNEKNR